MVRGVAVEGLADAPGGRVRPVAVAVEDRATLARASGLSAGELVRALVDGSDTGGDLVCVRVDWLAALIALAAGDDFARALWRGERATVGDYALNLVPALCLWIKSPERSVRITDVQRWIPPDAGEASAIYDLDTEPPLPARWRWGSADIEEATAAAEGGAAWAGALGRAIDAALGRAGLPRQWRSGTGRVAGALLDRMASAADIAAPPGVLDRAIQTAYVGGRISVFQAGRYDRITQIDLRSAYPWAMADLPSLAGAHWVRRRHYDPSEPYGLWRVSWDVPRGAVSGPLPVRTAGNAIVYPLAGSGWYWAEEVRAALECYGPTMIRPGDGLALRPASDRRPFAELADWYGVRRTLKAEGDTAAAHVLKLALTSCYGRLAQSVQWNGKPGRWGNLALAGMTTAAVRARMMRVLFEYETTAIALATDSLTVAGDAGERAGDGLGEWSVAAGGDALMLPSGVFRVKSGAAAMDRVSGVERARALLINWDDLYQGWDVLGLALRYNVRLPVFVGLGMAGAGDAWGAFGSWRIQRHEIVGKPHGRPHQVGARVWRILPGDSKPLRAHRYVPRAGVVGRLDDQGNRAVPDVAREHDQPLL